MREQVRKYLEDEPKFRERKNKDAGIANLLMREYPALKSIGSRDTVVLILQNYATMDRAWRDVLLKNEKLRGSDYSEKYQLEEKKKEELGYGHTEEEAQQRLPYKE